MSKHIKNLLKDSKAYYKDNDYYEIFSKAEDATGEVERYLKKAVTNKIVLDAGCGTGKYLETLEKNSIKYIGLDLSKNQLEKAYLKSKKENTQLIQSNLLNIPLEEDSIDIIISSWVLGTITNLKERKECLEELKRVLKPNGKIILVENASNSEFEEIRNHTKDNKTNNYNEWLLSNNFKEISLINNYFLFETKALANKCFEVIYGKEVANKIISNKIEHKIIILEYDKNN